MVGEVLDRRCGADRRTLHRVSATLLDPILLEPTLLDSTVLELWRLWPEGEGLLRRPYGPARNMPTAAATNTATAPAIAATKSGIQLDSLSFRQLFAISR